MEQQLERHPWLTPLILGVLCVVVFGPQVIGLPPDRAFGDGDIPGWFIPSVSYITGSVRAGSLPLWNPHQFAGYPTVANPQLGIFYPATWLALLLPVNLTLALSMVAHLWFTGVGMAVLARSFGATRSGALLAGVVFAFSEFMSARIWAGHYTLVLAACWLPWVLVAYRWAVRRGSVAAAALAGGGLGLNLLAGHPTLMVYILAALGVVWLYEMVARRCVWHPTRQLLLMGLAGAALAAAQLLPLAEFARFSQRAAEYTLDDAGEYALAPLHLATAVAPDLFGSPALENYRGSKNFEETAFYAGLFPLVGVGFALWRRSPGGWLFLALGALGVVLSLGRLGGLFTLFYAWIPFFRLARAPGRASLLLVLALAGLVGLLLSWLQRAAPEERRADVRLWARACLWGALGLAAFALLTLSAQPLSGEEGAGWQTGQALMAAALSAATLGVALWLWQSESGAAAWMTPLTIGLVALDLWRVALPLAQTHPVETPKPWLALEAVAGPGGDPSYRVSPWSVFFQWQNAATSGQYYSIDGYDPLEIAAYRNFLESVPDPRAATYTLLNVRYILTVVPLELPPIEGAPEPALLDQVEGWYVYERPNAQPRAFVARTFEVIADDDAALRRIHAPDFAPASHVILDREPPCRVEEGAGEATLVSYQSNQVTLAVESAAPALVVLSDSFYPGWQATVDGAPAEILRADVALRAVCVPAGRHTVTMTFRPASLDAGALVTAGGLAAWLMAGARHWRRRDAARHG